MPALEKFIQQQNDSLSARSLARMLTPVTREDAAYVVKGGKKIVSFSCNDYLGLAHHPYVKEAAVRALEHYGTGAGASRLITGNHPLYGQLEQKLSSFKQTESACVFGSGYMANSGVIQALAGKEDVIIADKLIHASLIDGIRLSGAAFFRFPHNNLARARALLQLHREKYRHCLIITETVFSMDGDVAPIGELAQLAESYDSCLLTDDAHGFGIVANADKGARIKMGTLSKALGSYGGYVCGSHNVINYIRSTARSLIYSTALPPASIAAAIASMEIIERHPELTALPLANARFFTGLLGMAPAQSSIVVVELGDVEKALSASALLEEEGFLVSAIRPPTVPPGTSRLRFTFSALHQPEDIERLAAVIQRNGWLNQ